MPSSTLRRGELRALGVPKQEPLDLSARRLRQLGDELDLARVGVGGQTIANVDSQLLGELLACRKSRAEDHERFDHFGTFGIWFPDHRGLRYGGMLNERA